MSRKIAVLILLLLMVIPAVAQRSPIEIKAYAGYDYSYSSESYGNMAAIGIFPVTEYFDMQVGIKAATENTYSVDGRATVRFPLKKGTLSLENRIVYQAEPYPSPLRSYFFGI